MIEVIESGPRAMRQKMGLAAPYFVNYTDVTAQIKETRAAIDTLDAFFHKMTVPGSFNIGAAPHSGPSWGTSLLKPYWIGQNGRSAPETATSHGPWLATWEAFVDEFYEWKSSEEGYWNMLGSHRGIWDQAWDYRNKTNKWRDEWNAFGDQPAVPGPAAALPDKNPGFGPIGDFVKHLLWYGAFGLGGYLLYKYASKRIEKSPAMGFLDESDAELVDRFHQAGESYEARQLYHELKKRGYKARDLL